MKRKLAGLLVCALCLTLSACGSSAAAVYVQSVERLAAMGGIAPGNRFLGMVVSEHTAEINRDADKTIAELLVKEGDDVQEGQALFSYDTEELQLNLDKKNLELEQLKSSIESYKEKIKTLERELDNSTVTSPITGRVQKINENDTTDSDGKPAAYITIQQSGAYRVKGVLGELQRGSLKEGDRVKMVPRTEENAAWTGTVTLVDYENPTQGSDTDRYSGMSSDEMTSASRYPFYVELDSTDGLMLGQHLYIELDTGTDAPGVGISGTFLCYNEDGSAYVWAEKGGKLEKRAVTLGDYDPMTDVQKITEGLSLEDYIAYPDPELCRSGAPTTHDQPVVETEPVMEPAVEEGGGM